MDNTEQPWFVNRRKGNLRATTQRQPETFLQAVRELAVEESDRTGEKISDAIVIRTLAQASGQFYTEQRRRLRSRVLQLNKENQHVRSGRKPR